MATAARRVALRLAPSLALPSSRPAALRAATLRARSPAHASLNPRRTFVSSTPRWQTDNPDAGDKDASKTAAATQTTAKVAPADDANAIDLNDDVFDRDLSLEPEELDAEVRAEFNRLKASISPEEEKEMDEFIESLGKMDPSLRELEDDQLAFGPEGTEELLEEIDLQAYDFQREFPEVQVDEEQDLNYDEEFMAMGEQKEDQMEDDEWENDDITSKGHAELEQVREIREYARWAAWELPMLSSKLLDTVDRLRLVLTLILQSSPNPSSHPKPLNPYASDTPLTLASNIRLCTRLLFNSTFGISPI
jgi:hypothetical protein